MTAVVADSLLGGSSRLFDRRCRRLAAGSRYWMPRAIGGGRDCAGWGCLRVGSGYRVIGNEIASTEHWKRRCCFLAPACRHKVSLYGIQGLVLKQFCIYSLFPRGSCIHILSPSKIPFASSLRHQLTPSFPGYSKASILPGFISTEYPASVGVV